MHPPSSNAYGHLSWSSVKHVSEHPADLHPVVPRDRGLFGRHAGERKVFELKSEPNTHIGIKRHLGVAPEEFEQRGYDWNAIYHVNHHEASETFYSEGTPVR